MKVEVLSALLIQWFYHKHKVLSERRRAFMTKLYQVSCLKYNNKTDFYRYGKDIHGRQKYQCKKFQHQWASEASRQLGRPKRKEYPSCPVCRRPPSCTTIWSITATTAVVTKSGTTPCSYQSLRRSRLHLCLSSLDRWISSGCATQSM